MDIRKFKLVKGADEYDLNAFEHFLHVPEGLGFDMTYTFLRSGESFIETDGYQSQKEITGEIVFRDYSEYTDFIEYIGDNDQLKFGYYVNAAWNYINAKVASIGKSEIGTNGVLICPVTFIAFGTWYTPLTYTGTSISIQNGSIPSPIRIEVDGALATFTWSIGGKTGTWNGTLEAGQTLVIDSNPESIEMAIYQGGTFVSNEYVNGDFETERFLYAPAGTNTLTVSKTSRVEVNRYAYSV